MRPAKPIVAGTVAIVLALFSTTAGFAEETPGAPQPTAEHKALAM